MSFEQNSKSEAGIHVFYMAMQSICFLNMERHIQVSFELGVGPDVQVSNMWDSGCHVQRTQLPVFAMSIGHIYRSLQRLAALITLSIDKGR